MSAWNPQLYKRFENERTQAASDLLQRVPLDSLSLAYDLGCGPGNSTELISSRYPSARVVGVDNSQAMLDDARKRLPHCKFELADIVQWAPQEPADLIYANASLQWVGQHRKLLPRLMRELKPCGALAVQMPDNYLESSHALMRELSDTPVYAKARVAPLQALEPLLDLRDYYDILTQCSSRVVIWRTTYQHALESPKAIVQWFTSTALKPHLEVLPPMLQEQYLQDYETLISRAYEIRSDSKVLLAFPRLFFVAIH